MSEVDDRFHSPRNGAESKVDEIDRTWSELHPDNYGPEQADLREVIKSGELSPGYLQRADALINAMTRAYSNYMRNE